MKDFDRWNGLKKRLNGTSVPCRQAKPAAFVELVGASGARADEYVIYSQPKDAVAVEGRNAAGLVGAAARLARSGGMIQITPQMRVLVGVLFLNYARLPKLTKVCLILR